MKITTVFTKSLTKALKAANGIHCRVNEESGYAYICNGFLVAKLNRYEYDALVRPVTQRDAGNWVLSNWEINPNAEPMDLETILANSAKEAVYSMDAAPMTFSPSAWNGMRKEANLVCYYSADGGFVAGFNVNYAGIVSGSVEFKGCNPVSPMVAFDCCEPVAMILPVRTNDKPNIVNAVRAYFCGGPEEATVNKADHYKAIADLERRSADAEETARQNAEEVIELSRDNDGLRQECARLHAESKALSDQIAELQAALAAKAEEGTAAAEETAESTEVGPEETGTRSIKFFYNGIKIDGGKKLIKCSYSLDNRHDKRECVTIYASEYSDSLPGDLFTVQNDTDSQQDVFRTDKADLFPDHPLYPYARAAAVSAEIHDMKRFIPDYSKKIGTAEDRSGYYTDEARRMQERLEKLETEVANLPKIPKQQPTAADVEAVHALNLAAETARLAAEHEKEIAEREKILNERAEGRRYIESVSDEYPVREGEPVVTIPFSENPAFYSLVLEDKELKLSVAAAEIVLKHYDEERARLNAEEGHGGYDKTDFRIDYTDASGEASTYEGRYDLGDNDGGMIAHIRSFGKFLETKGHFGNDLPTDADKESAASISALADLLEAHTAAASVVSVQVAPLLEEAARKRQEAKRQEVKDILDTVEMLTDQQLAAAVFAAPKDTPDVARFFLQELAKRDEKKALSVFRSWQNGEGLESIEGI